MHLSRATIDTPLATCLRCPDSALCALEFTGPRKRLTRLEGATAPLVPASRLRRPRHAGHRATRTWLTAYFAGEKGDAARSAARHARR
jgi:hypothetical protein